MALKKINDINSIDLKIDYDEDADVLYVSFGNPQKAVAKEIGSGKFVRFDPFTDEIVGVTILDFKERYMLPHDKEITESTKKIISEMLDVISQ